MPDARSFTRKDLLPWLLMAVAVWLTALALAVLLFL